MAFQITCALALSLFALAYAGHEPTRKCKQFSGRYDCPSYTVTGSDDEDFEIRNYAKSTWVVTEMGPNDSRSAFFRLFNYIQGGNKDGRSISMTAPVIMQHELLDDGTVSEDPKAMSFYLLENDSPESTVDGVDVDKMFAFTVYVRSYGGFSSKTKVQEHIQIIMDKLDAETKASITGVYVAGYDSPFTWFGRHNEVWVKVGPL